MLYIKDKKALFLVIYMCWRDSFIPMPIPGFAHYVIMAFFAFYLFSKGLKIHSLTFLFLIWAALSTLFANPSPVFRSWERLFSFFLLMLLSGPFNISRQALDFKIDLFRYSLWGIVCMSVASLFTYFTGNSMFYHDQGFFKGVYNHSMTLGPMAAISTVFTMQLFLTDRIVKRRKYWLALALCSAMMCMLASSRTAFVAMSVALLGLLIAVYKERLGKLVTVLTFLTIILTLTSPLWYSYTEGMRKKNANQDLLEDNSRTELWNERIIEFKNSPIYGQGFSAFNTDLIKGNSFNSDTGVIEPGSSWLFVLSSLGIVGFMIFFLLIIPPTFKLFIEKQIDPGSMAMTGLGVAIILIIHMLSEGYIIAAGSVICFFAWLCFAVIQPITLFQCDLYTKKWLDD